MLNSPDGIPEGMSTTLRKNEQCCNYTCNFWCKVEGANWGWK